MHRIQTTAAVNHLRSSDTGKNSLMHVQVQKNATAVDFNMNAFHSKDSRTEYVNYPSPKGNGLVTAQPS